MEYLISPEGLLSLLTLTVLEIVLGIDNLIFISIIVARLPHDQQGRARAVGLSLALILRIAFLFGATFIASLIHPLFSLFGHGVSGRDLIMFGGGFFLLAKATTELHNKLEGEEHGAEGGKRSSFAGMIVQIIALDLVFSIDSVITAIGLTQHIEVMIIAVVTAVIVMQLSAGSISRFIEKHPTIKILALAFLLMVGMVLVLEGFHVEVPKPYVYFAMAFSVAVEMLNLRFRRKQEKKPVKLRTPSLEEPSK